MQVGIRGHRDTGTQGHREYQLQTTVTAEYLNKVLTFLCCNFQIVNIMFWIYQTPFGWQCIYSGINKNIKSKERGLTNMLQSN